MKKFFLFMLLSCAVHWLQAQDHVPGHVLVQYRHGFSPDSLLDRNVLLQNDVSITRCISKSWNIWLLTTTPGNEEHAISFLYHQRGVQTVQLNHYLTRRGVIPDDSLFSQQWNLQNTGQVECNVTGTPGADINATNAWTITTGGYTALGDTIVVAVVDGGTDLNQEDLSFWKNTREIPDNGIDDDHNGYIDDYNGWNGAEHDDHIPVDPHGCHVCGIVAAKGNNGIGISGVNWNTLIMPLALELYTEDEIVEDYTYVFNQRRDYNQSNGAKGAFVVATNSSFGIDYGLASDYPLWCAMYDSLGSVGILSAAATTNNAVNVDDVGDMPTTCPSNYLVAVTDMKNTGYRNSSAGFGPINIDLDAPGTCITSTLPYNTFGQMSGTSMASPHVAGAIALMYAAGCPAFIQAYHDHPDSIALIVKQLILAGVDTRSDMVGNSVSGGSLDVYNSMQLLLNQFCDTCMVLGINTTPVSCYGETNGSAALKISGGKPPYSILWSTGDTTLQLTGLAAGVYSVQVGDSNHCIKSLYFNLSQPDSLLAGYTITSPTGRDSNGVITTQVVGGVSPYTFHWGNGDTTQNLDSVVGNDTYFVTVTDANQCSRRDTIVIYVNGISMLSEEQVKIFPNPTTGDIQLEMPAAFINVTAQLVDMTGQILWSGEVDAGSYMLPVSALQKGVYILRLNDGQNEVVKKIVRL